MTFRLEALRANKGDALLLHYGTNQQPRLAVIDGGPSKTYKPFLKPALQHIRSQRGLGAGQPLVIDLLMVSHIDDDHIRGVLELTGEMAEAKRNNAPPPYAVTRLWHNTFDDIIKKKPQELTASITAQFGAASTADVALARSPNLSPDAAMILVSVAQGRTLRDDAAFLGLAINPLFGSKLILQDGALDEATVDLDGLEIIVIGPMKPELLALQKEHDDWLVKNGKATDSPEAALAAFSDESVPNLSSIVIEARSGGKSMLLTGDARGDKIIGGLKALNLLSDLKPHVVDVLKVPHHGSDNNVTEEFFEQVRATHYVFSGNGQHGNPERETLRMLFQARRNAGIGAQKMHLYITYPLGEVDEARRAEWDKEFMKGHKTRKWDPAKDSLQVFFDNAATDFPDVLFEKSAGDPIRIEP